MPQLNPAPWFTTMVITWLLIMTATHLIQQFYHTPPTNKLDTQQNSPHWNWKWQ